MPTGLAPGRRGQKAYCKHLRTNQNHSA